MKETKKLAVAGLLIALAVVCSGFSIPVGLSKCFPVQHFVNLIAGVFLGPVYGVCMAFVTSLIRLCIGTGTLLAFPGSMVGALLCGLLYGKIRKLWAAFLGEIVGTGILGALLAYPVAVFLMGKEAAFVAYVLPFSVSSIGGAVCGILLMNVLIKTKVFSPLAAGQK